MFAQVIHTASSESGAQLYALSVAAWLRAAKRSAQNSSLILGSIFVSANDFKHSLNHGNRTWAGA